eukprot:19720-Chlamydomonas_euryale.AAC.6
MEKSCKVGARTRARAGRKEESGRKERRGASERDWQAAKAEKGATEEEGKRRGDGMADAAVAVDGGAAGGHENRCASVGMGEWGVCAARSKCSCSIPLVTLWPHFGHTLTAPHTWKHPQDACMVLSNLPPSVLARHSSKLLPPPPRGGGGSAGGGVPMPRGVDGSSVNRGLAGAPGGSGGDAQTIWDRDGDGARAGGLDAGVAAAAAQSFQDASPQVGKSRQKSRLRKADGGWGRGLALHTLVHTLCEPACGFTPAGTHPSAGRCANGRYWWG